MAKFKITSEELGLCLYIALLGFVFMLRPIILFFDTLKPWQGLVIYYVVLYGNIYLLSRLRLTVWKIHIEKPMQVLGASLVLFAFFMATNMGSPYVQYIARNGHIADVTNIFYQTEDGVIFAFWNSFIPLSSINLLGFLTYILSPFLIALVGVLLVSKRVSLF